MARHSIETSPQGSEKRARLSCVNCRKRKVKCDRKEPHCTACEKHQEQCQYPLERKRVVRRSAYKDMATRLAKMERLISDFAHNGPDDSASPAVSDASHDTPVRQRSVKRGPSIVMESSPIEETDFAWSIPEHEQTPHDVNLNTALIRQRHDVIETEEGYQGACSIFSRKGVEWVNLLVGDDSFGQMMSNFNPVRKTRDLQFMADRTPLPPNEVLIACAKTYFQQLNKDIHLFREEVIMGGLESYLAGNPNSSLGWYAAMNIMVAHCLRHETDITSMFDNKYHYDHYVYNAMSLIPTMMLSPVDEVSVGALLSIVLYFMFGFENVPATTILGTAIQQILIAKYHYNVKAPGCSEEDFQQRRRLFWNAYLLDVDLSLRLTKPPVHSLHQIIELPPEIPSDGIGLVTVSGHSFHFLREHVRLAKIQSKAYALLYSDTSVLKSPEQLYDDIVELDEELHEWKDNVPEPLRPQNPLDKLGSDNLMFLTVLHYTYFQLIIVVHSVVFHGWTTQNPSDREEKIVGSVTLCVGAARASIALLNYHDNSHPFTRYLLNHVAWSVDILFMNILQNKTNPRVIKDLKLLEKIVTFYQKYDPERDSNPSYQLTKTMLLVATRAVRNAQGDQVTASIGQQFSNLDIKDTPMENPEIVPVTMTQSGFPPMPANGSGLNNGFYNMPFIESEWMMPLGFQREYWQDPWANVFQDPETYDMGLP
ncbi:Zn2/Cys6 DNA-binding protein [Glarea lozoyensis ATCC 20868]|uniref:Zn2/Cys6 DNA-binding protein n=1 Tax=Glarea lozoyensis (strain ATCC 20868 / MF5171) TaxID=1116229 RepID=S3CPQ0_GLAL2|nr:Zn2/Cys6 DNA-binding protein [Glarea lozoyensis ATCC 20868]EPE27670.1 Zn2/Cys6 DNA-binding protein [Glarea lozoyensis ATCC 20868]